MKRLLSLLDGFWFAEAPATRLALVRILVGAFTLVYVGQRYSSWVSAAAAAPPTWFEPAGPVALLAAPIPVEAFRILLLLTLAANVVFILGWGHRVSGPLFAGLLLFVLSYRNSWGNTYHSETLPALHVLILGLTRAADALSLVSLLRSRSKRTTRLLESSRARDSVVGWQYGYPLRLICTVMLLTYFLAGVAKVAGPLGWSWATGEVLRGQVAFDTLRKDLLSGGGSPLTSMLYDQLWLFTLLAIGSLALELGAPVVLLHRRLAHLWVVGAFLMHWGIYFMMEINFWYQLFGVAFAPFFDVERLLGWLRPRSIKEKLANWRGTFVGSRLPRPAMRSPRPVSPRYAALRRPLVLGAALVVLTGGAFAGGMLTARGLPSGPTSPGPSATPTSRQSAAASPRQTPTPARRRDPTPTAAPTAAPAPIPTATAEACPEPCGLFQIAWVGDILLGDLSQRYLDRYGYTWPFEYVRPLLKADFVVGNHEGPITERSENYFPNEQWDYNARPASAKALAEVGFNAIGLSNNHVLDRGPEGLADTLRYLREAGIRPFGAGLDRDEAAAPLLITSPHGTLGVLAFGEAWRQGAVAGADQAGTVPFSDENIARGAQAARANGAQWVVGFVQWGGNYEPIRPRQRQLAASFARAGYSLVVGHHPHIVQEVDVVEGMPVLYSIGNFAFGTSGRFTPQAPGYGLVARTSFGPRGLRTIELSCILTDNDVVKFQPRPCAEEQARSLIQSLGPQVTWKDGIGLLVR